MADSKKYNGSTWEHSLRKLTTATEAVENPLYSDGTAITSYTISGNTVQNGTGTPDNPVDVNGVGVRTENLFDNIYFEEKSIVTRCTKNVTKTGLILTATSNDPYVNTVVASGQTLPTQYHKTCINVKPSTDYILSANTFPKCYISYLNDNYFAVTGYSAIAENVPLFAFTTAPNCTKIIIRLGADIQAAETVEFSNIMLIEGNTAPTSYIHYGYKIPISSDDVTTNIYLGNTQTTRQIKKLVLDGTESTWQEFSGLNLFRVSDRSRDYRSQVDGALCDSLPLVVRSELTTNTFCWSTGTIGEFIININNYNLADLKTYLSSNPITIWYVLATPETATVNEPLMKIGDYADTLSNATSIPTTDGANSITVDTTVQPSEFTATWTGWHNANVKEWDGSDWQ